MSTTNVDRQFNDIANQIKSTQKAIAHLRGDFNEVNAKVCSLERLLKYLKERWCY